MPRTFVGLALAGLLLVAGGSATARAEEPLGTVAFSKSPIDPKEPKDLATKFAAGDSIYAVLRWNKPFEEVYPEKDQVMIRLVVGEEPVFYQYLDLKTPEVRKLSHVVLDVVPEPARMVAYRNPAYGWGKGHKQKTLGPHAFSFFLSRLPPGKHKITIEDFDFGESKARGSFEIEGQDFSVYAARHEEIEKAMNAVATMPPRQMQDADLEAKMKALLENAGRKDLRGLRIIDKDWWTDRVAGGDSAVESRHIAAAAASKAEDGTFTWRIFTFHQRALLGGGFGALELTHTSDPMPIAEENLEK